MADPAFLACDWGTTNLRAWLVGGDGEVLAEKEFALGVARLGPGEAQARFVEEVRPALSAQGLPHVPQCAAITGRPVSSARASLRGSVYCCETTVQECS